VFQLPLKIKDSYFQGQVFLKKNPLKTSEARLVDFTSPLIFALACSDENHKYHHHNNNHTHDFDVSSAQTQESKMIENHNRQ